MILGSTRVRAGDARKAVAYLFDHGEPELITGDPSVARDADIRASISGGKYSLRHWYLSPDQPLSRAEVLQAVHAIFDEFEVGDRPFCVVQHIGVRADGTSVPHYHIVVAEHDEHGRVLSSKTDWLRQEKLSRTFELEFAHELTQGRHGRSVVAALERDGKHVLAAKVQASETAARQKADFSKSTDRRAARLGYDLPALVHALKALRGASLEELPTLLHNIECDAGVAIREGDRRNGRGVQPLVAVTSEGHFLVSVTRVLQLKRADTTQLAKGIENERHQLHARRSVGCGAAEQRPHGSVGNAARTASGSRQGPNSASSRSARAYRAPADGTHLGRRGCNSHVALSAALRSHVGMRTQPAPFPVAAIEDAMEALRAWAIGMELELKIRFNSD